MKTITNLLLIFAGISLPFLYSNTLPEIKNNNINPNIRMERSLDSLEKQIKKVDEITITTLKNNNKILQNTKEELLRVGICIDSVCTITTMENCAIDTVASLK